nr:putative reverse transcriptase domain-containing protein [Tanacetum cinerariifolium]
MLRGIDQLTKKKDDKGMQFIWVPLIDVVRTLITEEDHTLRYLVHPITDKTYDDLRDMYGGHADIGESSLIRPELVQETTNKEYWTDVNMHVPLEEIKVHKTLRFVEEPVEIIDRKVKSLKRSSISIVKACWDSERGHEDFIRTNYSHLLIEQVVDGSTS